MKRVIAGLVFAFSLSMAFGVCAAPKPQSRQQATEIVADMRRVVTDNGVERLEKVRIGGIDQWISIRGSDRRNPVLLMLHGGPAGCRCRPAGISSVAGRNTSPWCSGTSAAPARPMSPMTSAKVGPTMTRERMVADAEEMVAWLRHEFGKDKIFVLGHSWGSYLGLELAQRRPQWLHAYIGVGQISNAPESERRGWAWTRSRRATMATPKP